MDYYAIGIDYGTLSARALMIDVRTGAERADCVWDYAHGVISDVLPGSKDSLPPNFALQDPRDYMEATVAVLKGVLEESGVDPAQVIGIGLDSTACTLIPLDENYQPLCFDPRFRGNPHSWIKLWKHHGAQAEAEELNQVAREMGLAFLNRCGGMLASEYGYPKILETLRKAPEVYKATHRFMEVGDWVAYLLTGQIRRNAVLASFHLQWDIDEGYPPNEYFKRVDPRLDGLIENKIGTEVHSSYEAAGSLTKEMAKKTGLLEGTPVCNDNGDGNIPLSCLHINREGLGALTLGTSCVLMFLTKKAVYIPGSMGLVNNVLLPGYYGHVFGQSAAGDALAWYMENLLPYKYHLQAQEAGLSSFEFMNRKLSVMQPGENGLVALDWYNGCRSMLMDATLSSALVGLTIATRPEDVYRAIVESIAFGLRNMLEGCDRKGVQLDKIHACGGIARKNPVIMQILCDVLGIPIRVSYISQTTAIGSAISGAVAAGPARGGYRDILEAAAHMVTAEGREYIPNPEAHDKYNILYEEYRRLTQHFGGQERIMARLRRGQEA